MGCHGTSTFTSTWSHKISFTKVLQHSSWKQQITISWFSLYSENPYTPMESLSVPPQTKTAQIPRAQYLVSGGNRLPPALQQVQRFPAHPSGSALEAFPHLRKKHFCPKPVARTLFLTPALHCRWQSSPMHPSFCELLVGSAQSPACAAPLKHLSPCSATTKG